MTWEVLVSDLRKAAGSYQTVAGDIGQPVQITHVEPASIGHVELAAWVKAVVDQCDKATTALRDGANGLATSLQTAATGYETTDDQSGQQFRNPLLTGPLGSSGPFVGPTAPGAGGAR